MCSCYTRYCLYNQVPSKPGTPQITDTDASEMSVSWSAPTCGGGKSTDGYIVEYQEAETSMWTSCNKLVSNTLFTITNLKEYQRYKVRVKALYAVDCHGPTSLSSQPWTIQPKLGMYFCYEMIIVLEQRSCMM